MKPNAHSKNETVVKAVRMRKELADSIERLAKAQNRNFSNMAETLLLKLDYNGEIKTSAVQ